MNAWVIPKVIAVVPLSALFAFARIDMANAYYADLKVGGADQAAALATASATGQVMMPGVPQAQAASDWISLSLSLTGSKTKTGTGSQSKNGGSKSGTGSQSKNAGSKSGTASKSKQAGSKGTGSKSNAAGSKTGTGSKSNNGGSKTGTASKTKESGQSGTNSQTNTGTQSQSKHDDAPLLPPIPPLGI